MADGEVFRELRGDYQEKTGQVVNLPQYLDHFEPLGSALSRLPDGAGGPFVHQFTGSGGRVIGAVGWVVSAASKRYGGWKLWGLWTDGPVPALTLPLLWPYLSDPSQSSELVRRANDEAELLLRPDASYELLDQLEPDRLDDGELRAALKAHLSRLYRVRPPYERPLEVELDRRTLDLLPWLYLLGPVEPGVAQLQPSRFNGPGYQYILTESAPAAPNDAAVIPEVARMIDTAAADVLEGWRTAVALRVERSRPKGTKSVAPPPRRREPESHDMRTTPSTQSPPRHRAPVPAATSKELLLVILRALRDVVIVGLLAWIAYDVHQIRKAVSVAPAAASPEAATSTPATVTDVPVSPEPEQPRPSRTQRIAQTLSTQPPAGIRIDAEALDDVARGSATNSRNTLSRIAVEIFLRRNGCHSKSEIVDGKLSAAEQRSIRRCPALTTQKLMKSATEPDVDRATEWLERVVATR